VNNVWPVITIPNLNCCLSSSNKRKTYFILWFFSGKHTFPELRLDHYSSHSQHWLTYPITMKRNFFSGYTYVSPKAVALVTTFAHFSRHMNVPCFYGTRNNTDVLYNRYNSIVKWNKQGHKSISSSRGFHDKKRNPLSIVLVHSLIWTYLVNCLFN